MAEEETKKTEEAKAESTDKKPGLDSQVALDSFDKKEEKKKKKSFLSNFKSFNPFFIAITGIVVVVLVVLVIVFTGGEPENFIGTDLTEDELTSLISDSSENESTGQVLRIGPTTEFSQDISVLQDVEIVGNLVVAGEIISANSSLAGQNAEDPSTGSSDLQVDGDALFAGNVATQGSLTVNGTLTVNSGLTATEISSTSILATGDARFARHIVSQAGLVVVSPGAASGSGGTASASGNDIAGTVTINTGSGTAAGVLANIGFQQGYGSTPSVIITPVTSAAAQTEYFVTRTTTGFTIQTNTAAPIGSVIQFDYHIIE